MQQQFWSRFAQSTGSTTIRSSFTSIFRLDTGEVAWRRFCGEQLNVRQTRHPVLGAVRFPSQLQRLDARLMDITDTALAAPNQDCPILTPVPLSCVGRFTALERCRSMLLQAQFCPQEICFEVDDVLASEHSDWLRAARRTGFRLAVDARDAWTASRPLAHWMMFDAMLVRERDLFLSTDLRTEVERAVKCGVAIIVDGAHWRHAPRLLDLGASQGLNLRTDA